MEAWLGAGDGALSSLKSWSWWLVSFKTYVSHLAGEAMSGEGPNKEA